MSGGEDLLSGDVGDVGPEAPQLVVVEAEPGRLHLLLPPPLGAPVLEPHLRSESGHGWADMLDRLVKARLHSCASGLD